MIEAETYCHLVTLNKINIHNTSCVLTCESLLLICGLIDWVTNSMDRVLLERLTGPQAVNKFPTLYRNPRFNTAFTKACLPSLLWVTWTQFSSSHPVSLVFFLYPAIYAYVCPVACFLKVSPPITCNHLPSALHVPHVPPISANMSDEGDESCIGCLTCILQFVISRLRLTLRRLMSYIYGAPILDVSRSHTTTQHSR